MYKPGDPFYERYGSIEYTGGWIEEGGEVNFGAYDTLKTRVGRHLNNELGLKRKLFITCNPKKNWMYDTFYTPFKKGILPEYMYYLGCLVQENPFIEMCIRDSDNTVVLYQIPGSFSDTTDVEFEEGKE